MSNAKPFQTAAVEAALRAFAQTKGPRRFLVADEVGLGKTVVARDIVQRMAAKKNGPFIVYYIANGHFVAAQNRTRVVDFLPDKAKRAATKTPDRLSLIAITPPPTEGVSVYALTPQTSFPGANSKLDGGRKEERAYLQVLLESAFPNLAAKLGEDFLQLRAVSSWKWLLAFSRKELKTPPPGLTRQFKDAVTGEFETAGPKRLAAIAHLAPEEFVGRLRRALCLATLRSRPPDIVIFDEFQRYRHLLQAAEAGSPLVKALLAPDGVKKRPAVLLLSATPYRLFSTRWEESRGASAHMELFDLVGFLAGPECREQVKILFGEFGDRLREIAACSDPHSDTVQEAAAAAAVIRDELRRLLTPFISRTERDSVSGVEPIFETGPLQTDLTAPDVRVFRHLASSFKKRPSDAVPYWSSVPLPAQALGQGYAAWRQVGKDWDPLPIVKMTAGIRKQLKSTVWPDAKLRALGKIADPATLALPWAAPSLPWWALTGPWAGDRRSPKLLMFSRFKATPPSVAALMSFDVEAKWLGGGGRSYDRAYARRRFKLGPTPGPVMAAFHPSPWLIKVADPAHAAGKPLAVVRKRVASQIEAALRDLKIPIVDATVLDRRRHRSIGKIIAGIEHRAGYAEMSAKAWEALAGNDKNASGSVRAWRAAVPLKAVSPAELSDLVEYALSAPGVVMGRALRRHEPGALSSDQFPMLVKLCWQGLRRYLDNPIFLSVFRGDDAVNATMRAVVEGGLESALDEYFWMRAKSIDGGAAKLAEDLISVLKLSAGGFHFHDLKDTDAKRIRIRCHAAVAFGDAESETISTGDDDEEPARAEGIRKAFNTPFWPHVLTTTSVGQEGLDFHPWCSRVVHWDLSSNPLDLEQREGRIQRFASLAVRRRLAADLEKDVLSGRRAHDASPWVALAEQAELRYSDASGLRPWWLHEGAKITSNIFDKPFGRDRVRFELLREQRMIYRLALGQPNQEDLLDIMAQGGKATKEVLRPLVLDLSAMGLRQPPEDVALQDSE